MKNKKMLSAAVMGLVFAISGIQQAAAEAESQPSRIVALAPHIVESLFEIGAGDRIVATVDYADYPEAALEIERIGGYYGLNMEALLSVNPDLVIAWKNGNKPDDLTQLKTLNVPLAYSISGNIAEVADELIALGELTGNQAQAKAAAERFRKKLSVLKKRYQNKAKVKVFYQLWANPMMTVNRNTWIHEIIRLCGGENVFADASSDYPQISLENVLVKSPEIIILPDEKSEKKQLKIDWQKWPEIPAVKNNAFVKVNADLIHRFSSRMLTGVEAMCQQIDLVRQK